MPPKEHQPVKFRPPMSAKRRAEADRHAQAERNRQRRDAAVQKLRKAAADVPRVRRAQQVALQNERRRNGAVEALRNHISDTDPIFFRNTAARHHEQKIMNTHPSERANTVFRPRRMRSRHDNYLYRQSPIQDRPMEHRSAMRASEDLARAERQAERLAGDPRGAATRRLMRDTIRNDMMQAPDDVLAMIGDYTGNHLNADQAGAWTAPYLPVKVVPRRY